VPHGDDGQEPPFSQRACERPLVALEPGADEIHVDARVLIAQLGPDRRPAAAQAGGAQGLHGPGQVAGVH